MPNKAWKPGPQGYYDVPFIVSSLKTVRSSELRTTVTVLETNHHTPKLLIWLLKSDKRKIWVPCTMKFIYSNFLKKLRK